MNEGLFLGILIGVILASIVWFYFKKNQVDKSQNIDVFEKEKVIASLESEKKGLLEIKKNLEETLKSEKELTKEQLKTINKIDDHKTAISEYTQITEERNKFDRDNIGEMKKYLEDLTGSSKFQGEFGEKILKTLLISCGFREGTDFKCHVGDKIQDPNDSQSLKRVIPDVLIRMEESYLVIDSKVSLDNWKNWTNEKKDKKLQEDHLKKHLKSITDHIQKLSTKKYSQILNTKVFPTTIMFIPFEACYLTAVQHDPNLGEKAYNKNIILAGPGNLMAIIKIVETIKSKQKQIESVDEIVKSATKIYEKYGTLKGFLKKLVTSYRTHGVNLENVIKSGWGGKDSLEKQLTDLKEKKYLPAKNIEKTIPEEDKIPSVNDPEDKGPFIH